MNVIEPPTISVVEASDPPSTSQIYTYLRTLGTGIVQFNHPSIYPNASNFDSFTFQADIDRSFTTLMELGTGWYDLPGFLRPVFGVTSDLFYIYSNRTPEFEFRQALVNGWHVGVTNGQDNHFYFNASSFRNQSLVPPNHTGVWATRLTRSGILEAIRARRTFASEDGHFRLWFTANGAPMGALCVPNSSGGVIEFRMLLDDEEFGDSISVNRGAVIIGGKLRDQGSVGVRGTLLPQYGEQTLTIPFQSDSFYYVRVRQRDGDLIFSSPVWTGSGNCAQASGRIYVSDRGNHRIVQINDLTGAGWTELGGVCGGGVLQFCSQHRIFVDGSGRIYVADNGNYRVVRMNDITGAGWLSFGGQGSGVGQFSTVVGIFVDGAGRIYVTDPQNARLVRVNDMSGSGWTSLGGFQTGAPTAVILDALDRIYVADAGRIVRVSDMIGSGRVTFGSIGSGIGQFGGNIDIALDNTGRIYIADENNHRIVRINDMSGAGWVSFGSMGSGVGQFQFPQGIFLDDTGRIYVVDSGNARVVRINDMSGAGWTAFGTRGSGVGQFDSPYEGFVR